MRDLDYFQSITSPDYYFNSTQEETIEIGRRRNLMAHEIKLDIFPSDESYDKHTAPPLEHGK